MHPYFNLFGLHIPAYGVMLVLGIAAGLILAVLWSCKKYGIRLSDFFFFAIYALIGALIGSKLLYIVVELPRILSNPNVLLSFITGGSVFYGGLIGGALGGLRYAHRYRLHKLEMLDIAAPSLALGQAFGRVGCYLSGCCYGAPSDSPLAVVYPKGSYAPAGVPLLPVQLLESAFLVLLSVLLLLILKHSRKKGTTCGWYLVLYAVWRFAIEFFRADPRGDILFLSTSQAISILLAVAGAFLLLRNSSPKEKSPES
ncbi:MAG: prolipoprotein diacylglyceryl transferase [Christensenellales bacterium]|jgi:phosphatidylglycerol:prolipoprotein diacylglycerol transferase